MTTKELKVESLQNALITLKDCWSIYQNNDNKALQDIISDSCVKRFEYTMETSLKIMRRYLKIFYGKEDKELTVNNIFRLMNGYDMVKNWENWRMYYAARNDTSHEYNLLKARELLKIIPQFLEDTEFLLTSLERSIKENAL